MSSWFGFGNDEEEIEDPNKQFLVIELYGGREITDPKSINSSNGPKFLNPYCTIRLADKRVETEVLKSCMNPVWQQNIEFDITDVPESAVVLINCYHSAIVGRDFLGEVRLPIAEHKDVCIDYAAKHWFPLYNPKLKKKDGSPGEIGLKIGVRGGEYGKSTNNYNSDFDNRTAEEIYEEANVLAQESNASAHRSLRIIEQTREIGTNTVTKIREQGAQIDRMQSDMDTVHNNMKQSERRLRSIESVWGTMANTVTSKSNKRYKKKAKEDRKILKRRAKDEKRNRKIKQAQWKERHETDRFVSRKRNDMVAKDPGSRYNTGNQEQLFEDTVEDTDKQLDRIGTVLDDLKSIALDMGTELNEQNQRLDSLRYDIEKAQPRMAKSVNRARNIVK